jgi:pimeloyl-ACP methyl ester carboxylesterase
MALEPAVVVGHSWGTLVALALALNYPEAVRSLVLLSGYYYTAGRMESIFGKDFFPKQSGM